MEGGMKKKLVYELLWLLALILLSAVMEYAIIVIFDLHPALSVKMQGIIGLLIFGYGVRMVARLLSSYKISDTDQEDKSQDGIELKSDYK